MALTVINSSGKTTGMPSAPMRKAKANLTGPTSYVTGGESLATTFPGQTVFSCRYVPTWNGAALRWARIEDSSGAPMLKFYETSNGAPAAEVAAGQNMTGHTFDIDFNVE